MVRGLLRIALVGVVAMVAGLGVSAGPAEAFVSSASIDGSTVTLNLAGALNTMTVSASGGLLVHDQTTPAGGLNSRADWDSARDGDQTVPADGTFTVIVNGSAGPDALTVLAARTEVAAAVLNGAGGDDVLIGADSDDTLNGGDGDDRLVGGPGNDTVNGGAGNDTLVWSNPDASDTINGDGGNDGLEVNGSPLQGDAFLLEPVAGRVRLTRLNLRTSRLDVATERIQVNGLGGPDFLDVDGDVSGLTRLSVDGGTGNDTIFGTEGPDLIRGGEGADDLHGGGGDDRIAGDGGSDTINGDAGDDTLVWNDGDGSDLSFGGDGRDDVEVNGAPTDGDLFTVQQNGPRIRLERINLQPISLDIGSSETLHVNGLGGDDEVLSGTLDAVSLIAAGDAGNDALTGGGSADTLLGGSGDDTISGGGGRDVVSGDEGDDQVDVRDGVPDLASGGAGQDTVAADPGLDLLDGFEVVHAAPLMTPPPGSAPPPTSPAPVHATRPVTILGGTLKLSRRGRTAPVRLGCPSASDDNCRGRLALRTANSVRLAGRTRVVGLGHATYDLRPGTSMTVKVTLTVSATRVADRNGRIKALAIASALPADAVPQSSRRVTLAVMSSSRNLAGSSY